MKDFINNSNTGMKSRITHIVEFIDYTDKEMCQIFHYLVDKEKLVVEDKKSIDNSIKRFLKRLRSIGTRSLGNGRLMRKLLKSSISFMAERENDYITLILSDIDKAIEELEEIEKLTITENNTKSHIGFLVS